MDSNNITYENVLRLIAEDLIELWRRMLTSGNWLVLSGNKPLPDPVWTQSYYPI